MKVADDDFVRMAELGLGSPTGSDGGSSNWQSDTGAWAALQGGGDRGPQAEESLGDGFRSPGEGGATALNTGAAAATPTESGLEYPNSSRLQLLETPDIDTGRGEAMLSGGLNTPATGPGTSRASGRQSPPIVVPKRLPTSVDYKRTSGEDAARADVDTELPGNRVDPIDGNASLELIYDHVLNAYYDPATGHYYELAT